MRGANIIKKYIWLNPIVEAMLRDKGDMVKKLLEGKGYTIVTCVSGANHVREKYGHYVHKAKRKPVIDARCPQITALIDKKYPQLHDNIAPISPILVVCAEFLYRKYIESDSEAANLTVIAPCSWLVDKGTSILGEKVHFITWVNFCEENKIDTYPQLRSSPVPPGFFDGLKMQVLEGNGKQRIEAVLELASEGLLPVGISLLELLYCEGGCHRGDGV